MISHITQTLIKDIGDTAEMACTTLYTEDFNVLWVKVDNEKMTDPMVFSSGSTLIVSDSRLSVRRDMNSSRYILQVSRDMIK